MKRLLIAVALILWAVSANAACPTKVAGNVACISWLASPGWSNNAQYAAIDQVRYTVVLVNKTTRAVIREVGTTPSLDLTTSPGSLQTGEQCFAVKTVVTTPIPEGGSRVAESGLSNVACKNIRPASPTDGAIERPSDGAIEDR